MLSLRPIALVASIAALLTMVNGVRYLDGAEQQRLRRQPPANNQRPEGQSPAAIDSLPTFTEDGVEVIRERYPDGKVKIERQVALDRAGNYVNHGDWRLLNPSGDIIASGQFDMGVRVGRWLHWHSPQDAPALREFPFKQFKGPFQSQATFVDGKLEGEWLIQDAASRKCLQLSMTEGKRHGSMILWLPNGNVYRQASFEHGVPVGEVLEADPKTGQLKAVATYVNGRKLATRTTNSPGGKRKKSEEQLLEAATVEQTPDDFWTCTFAAYAAEGENQRHGTTTMWYDNGQLQHTGVYDYGKKSGSFTYYYDNGQVAAAGEYRDDQPVGPWIWWHRNGQKATMGEYAAGRQVNDWRWWADDGKLINQQSFEASENLLIDPAEQLEATAPSGSSLR